MAPPGQRGCLATSWVLATSRGPRAGLRVVAHDLWRAVSESRCVPFCVQPDNDSLQPMDHTARNYTAVVIPTVDNACG